jgi:hypothetical protein
MEEEVVPLDRRADGGGDHGATKLHPMFGRGEGIGSGQVVAGGGPTAAAN